MMILEVEGKLNSKIFIYLDTFINQDIQIYQ